MTLSALTAKERNFILTVFLIFVFFWLLFFFGVLKLPFRASLPDKPFIPGPEKCGLQECHGADLTCGSEPVEMCTAIFEVGDTCRRFAGCEVVNGNCRLAANPKFSQCQSCIKNCERRFPTDSQRLFECAGVCGEI